jgi:hypothetical protein
MFDRYYQRDPYPQHITVTSTEKRAPTDESVRLLVEMEAAARAKVIQSIRLENTPVDCVIHVGQDYAQAKCMVMAAVMVNGKRLEVQRDFDLFSADQEKIATTMLTAISERIAIELLAPAFAAAAPKLRFK